MAYRRKRTYRRRKLIDMADFDFNLVKKVSHQYHKDRTGHYGVIGNPLRNYKDQIVRIPTVSQRRTSPISETYGNKILPKSMAYRRKRTYRPRKRFVARRRKLQALPLGIPRSKVIRVRVVTQGFLTANSGTLASVMLKANSINDPTGTLSAYLPHTVDQYASMYQQYLCLGSKLKIRPVNVSSTGAVVFGVHLADNNTALANVNHYKMLPHTKQRILTTQKDLGVITMGYSAKKFWHLNNIKDDSEQEATFSTTPGDPGDVAYYHVYCNDLRNNENCTVEFQVEMEFILLLKDPITIAESSL